MINDQHESLYFRKSSFGRLLFFTPINAITPINAVDGIVPNYFHVVYSTWIQKKLFPSSVQ